MYNNTDRPRTFEDWLVSWLEWLGGSRVALNILAREDLTAKLDEQFPGVFDKDFDVDKYYERLAEETAEMNNETVHDLNRRIDLKLVR